MLVQSFQRVEDFFYLILFLGLSSRYCHSCCQVPLQAKGSKDRQQRILSSSTFLLTFHSYFFLQGKLGNVVFSWAHSKSYFIKEAGRMDIGEVNSRR